MWWDPEADDWMMDGQMPDGTKLMLPLDVNDYWSVPEAAAAAAALTTDGSAVRVVPGPEMLDTQLPSIFHIADQWAMWLPCEDCGGCELPLRHGGRLEAAAATGQAKRIVELAASEGCPACVSAMFRDGRLPPDTPPLTWYDPVEDQWMLWQPVEGMPEGVTMPLGLSGYDVSRIAVEVRVEQLLFGDEPSSRLAQRLSSRTLTLRPRSETIARMTNRGPSSTAARPRRLRRTFTVARSWPLLSAHFAEPSTSWVRPLRSMPWSLIEPERFSLLRPRRFSVSFTLPAARVRAAVGDARAARVLALVAVQLALEQRRLGGHDRVDAHVQQLAVGRDVLGVVAQPDVDGVARLVRALDVVGRRDDELLRRRGRR